MFRICKAEFKKLFYKPGIYILAGVLIFVLACCSFLYRPDNRDNPYVQPRTTPATVQSFYNELTATGASASVNSLEGFASNLISAKEFADSYKVKTDLRQILLDKIDEMVAQYQAFIDSLQRGSSANTDVEREKFIQSFIDFRTYYRENVGKYNGSSSSNLIGWQEIHILTNSSLNRSIINYLSDSINDMQNASSHSDDVNAYVRDRVGSKFAPILQNYVNKLIPFTPEEEYVASLYDYIDKSNEVVANLRTQINEFYLAHNGGVENTKSANIQQLSVLATKFKLQCQQTLEFVSNGIYLNALKDYNANNLRGFYGLENFDKYEATEEQTRLLYYFDNGTYSIDYANPFSVAQPSNFNLNCYDFSYYALRLCMFIIIIYVITVAATTITGELQSGTMKLLAIRPYKRSKILGGKLLSTLLIGVLLILVSAVATLVMGLISYGGASMSVLVVFNSTSAVAMSPIWLYLIMLVTLIVEMSFFVLLALAISLLFKSQIGAVAVSIMAFFGTLVLNTLLGKASWLAILPFTNINLYKYFGSSFISTSEGFLQAVLTSPVATGTNFWLSFIYTVASLVVLTVLVFEVFKHRDMK